MSIDLGSAFGSIIIDAGEALKTTEKLGGVLGGLGGPMAAMGTVVVAAGAAAGGALVALGASSVGVAREFESSMAIMSTAVDPDSLGVSSSAEAMKILSEASLQVGSDTALVGVSASSSAEAITGLYKAGLSTGEIFGDLQGYMAGTSELSGALRASVDLAAASELDMVQASELAAITLATFGGELTTAEERADFVNNAMNNFVQTADGSVASVADLADAFKNVGATAAGMGIPLDDVNTMLGVLSTRGIAGGEAGTAVKSMLTNMMTAPKAADALEELGVSLYTLNGDMRSMPAIIGDLETAMAGMTDEQRNATMVQLAGSYGQKALSSLLAEGAEGWRNMEDAIGNAATMQETAAARTDTLAGAQEALSGVWEAFQIKVGTALIPVLTTLADIGSSLLEKYGPTLTAAFENFGAIFSSVVEAVSNFFLRMEAGISTTANITGLILQLAGAFGMSGESTGALGMKLNEFFGFLAPLIEYVTTAVTQFFSWQDVMLALGAAVATVVIPVIISIAAAIAPVLLVFAAVIAVVALLRNAWENNWGGIQEKTAAVIAFIQNLIQTAFAAIQAFWTAHGEQIMATAAAAWAAIQAGITAVITIIKTIVTNALTAIQGFWDKHGAKITEVAEKAWGLISDLIDGAFKTIQKLFEAFKLLFEGDWEGFLDKAGELWETAWNTMVEFLSGLWDLVKPILLDFWEEVKVWFREKASEFQGIGTALIGGLVAGIDSAKETIRAALQGIADNIPDWLKQMLGIASPARATIPIGYAIAQGIVAGIQAGAADVQSAMESIFSAMGNVAGVAGAFGSQFVRQTLDPAREKFKETGDELAAIDDEMLALAARWGGEELLNSPTMLATLGELLKSQHLNDSERANIQRLISLYDERNRKQTEYVDLQQKVMAAEAHLADLEERRAQNQFLQDQLKLLELIKDNNLGADILNGIKLGIDADAKDLMLVMSMALQRMIEAAQAQLGIASPSKIFRAMGRNLMESMGLGIGDGRAVVGVMRDAMSNMTAAGRAGLQPTQVDNGQTANLYGGQHFYIQQARRNVLDDIQVLLAR